MGTMVTASFAFGRAARPSVAREVFGTQRLRGILVVDRYNGYNQMPCLIQYCYAHPLREVQDLGKEFPEVSEVSQFVASFAPLLAEAMKLRAQELPAAQYRRRGWNSKWRLRLWSIARKISFGSQSEQGAQTREILMSVLHTLRKRTDNVFDAFLRCLDALAENTKRDPYGLLFDSS